MNQTIGVSITPQSVRPTLHYSQGDVGRVFVINVTGYDIPPGATVTCVATKPSGMGFTVNGTVSGNTVTFTSTAEMTDEWGRFPAEIRIASGSTLLGTANFLMVGEKDPHPASTIDGTQEELIPQLTLLVNRVEAAAESVHDLTVSATTLTAGSDATATYDSTNNSIAFGIPRGADGDVTRSEFNDLKSEISDIEDLTLNLFNDNQLIGKSGISQVSEHEFSGTATKINAMGGLEIAGGFEANTRYTISILAHIATSAGSSNGLALTVTYTDSTSSVLYRWTRDLTSYTEGTRTTASGKTVSSITIGYSNGGGDTWYLKDIQIEKGTSATPYSPSVSALDLKAIRSTNLFITNANISTTYDDCDDFPSNSIIGLHKEVVTGGIAHAPSINSGLEVITFSHMNSERTFQYALPFSYALYRKMYVRSLGNDVWTDWVEVNTDPSYMGFDLFPTGDQTDRGDEIANILSAKKVCRLAAGDYYFDVLVLNQGRTLKGVGNSTRLIKASSPSYNYMIRMRTDSKIKDVSVYGSLSDITPSSGWDLNASPANPCGIRIEGSGSDDTQRFRCEISNVRVSNFAGAGIYINQTGYNTQGGCHINNAFVRNCNAGIVFAKYAEFHRTTGCNFNECYYGAVNNGGNNVFENCDFSSNIQGLLMDNSSGTYSNSSHGSFVGCSFNHSDSNNGTAIELNTMVAGEVFVGCNIFYGAIILTSSQGIVFNSCNLGSSTPITITDGGGIQFANCVFRTGQSPVTDNRPTKTHFDNCYYLNGSAVNGVPA